MHNEVNRSTVHGHVVQAHEIGTLHVHSTDVPYPPLTSWQDRPDLTTELEDLLHVQRDAAETLPYRLLGVRQPELTRVYVQQSVRETEREQGDRSFPIGEVLAHSNHLLVTGEPGAGKSTLGQMYVQRLATEWLDPSADPPLPEPVMPLRIPAKALADDLPWSELLANAVRDRRLNATLKPDLFAKRALGARWLVFVDGLDEIAEPGRRSRVIDALVSRMRRGGEHRLVITTRPLPPDELQKLAGLVDSFTIQPFGPVELQDFASAWFRAQNPTNAKDRAAEFVSQVHDGRLRELVRNPLLATIAAIANTLEPNRKLPHNRADLYDRFISYLLDDRANGRNALAELRKAHADDPARVKQIEWLYGGRTAIVEQIAVERLESGEGLLQDALPARTEDVMAVLMSTGLFVRGEAGPRFLHHSFAEFLAARKRAAAIPAEFPGLDEWVELGMQAARETSVLFTFVLWGREPGHDLDLVVERLLAGGVKHVLLAGRLLAEDVAITPQRSGEVVDRLVELVLANGVREKPWQEARRIGRVLASLDNESVARLLLPRLRALRDNTDLPAVVRIGCTIALGHLDSADQAVAWLRNHADLGDTNALSAIAAGLAEMVPNGADLAEQLLLEMVRASDNYVVELTIIDILSFDLDRKESARHLLRLLTRRLKADPLVLGSLRIPHIGGAADTPPQTWDSFIGLATALECTDEARWAADLVLEKSSVDTKVFAAAVAVLLDDSPGPARIADAISRARALSLEHVLIVAERTSGVENFDREVANSPAASDSQFLRACELMVTWFPDEADDLVRNRPSLRPVDLIDFLMTTKHRTIPSDLSTRALHGRTEGAAEFRKVLIGALDLGARGKEVYAIAAAGSPLHRAVGAGVLDSFGHHEHSADLLNSLLTDSFDPASSIEFFRGADLADLAAQGVELLDRLIRTARHEVEIALEIAGMLHTASRSEEASELAVDAFQRSLGSHEVADCVATVLDVSGARHADLIVTKVRESGLTLWDRLDIADLFVDEGMLHHAVELWLDVVRDHHDRAGKGVEAADKLVKVGMRARAVEAATSPKLRAWLQA
ncbi:NACHT domain-containing protein [Lentzea sp. NPDC055074]